MRTQRHAKPELSQEQAGNMLEGIYSACRLPFDRDAYAALAQKARRGRALRLAACALLAGVAAAAVLGALGVFAAGYLHNVGIQPSPALPGQKPPAATEAWIEAQQLVLRLEAGDYPIDYSRVTATLRGGDTPLEVSCDEAKALLRLPYAPGDAVYEITLFDAAGADYQIVVTVTE